MNRAPDWAESLYERLAEDDEGRVCTGISDAACRATPGNFLRMLGAALFGQVADRITSAKTTLPWLLLTLGAPAWALAVLVPLRESGSMLPQLLIGAVVRRRPIRKGVWVAGAVVQAACLVAMAGCAVYLVGPAIAIAVVLLLALFSFARGACSVAYKDVQGKTIPKTRRGRLAGWISAAAGLAAMGAGALLTLVDGAADATPYILLLLTGAACWLCAAVQFARIVEHPGATEGGANGLAHAFGRLALLRDDAPFRRFVIGRALAMGSGLAAPLHIMLARDELSDALALLGVFIAIEGLAGLASSPVWGRWADRSSRGVFAAASGLAGICSIATALWAVAPTSGAAAAWFYPATFFALGLAHAGVRLGRKTYLVDIADGNRRTDYVAVSNTVIGALLLAIGLLAAYAATLSVPATLLGLGIAGLLGALVSRSWRAVAR